MQALEGDIDTAHLGLLHMGSVSPDDLVPGTFDYYTVNDRAPQYKVMDTELGTMYGAYRPADAETYYWRIAHFLFPFYTLIPTGVPGVQIIVRAWVPVDDQHTMFWSLSVPQTRSNGAGRGSSKNGQPYAGSTGRPQFLPNTTDWLGRWRLAANASNDYGIDREVQRTQSFTGINGIHLQDQAVTESMGPIYNRTQEHLGTSDRMVIRTRKRLIDAAKALRDTGQVPPGVDEPKVYAVRSGGVVLPRGADWIEATQELRRAWVAHSGLTRNVLGGVPAV